MNNIKSLLCYLPSYIHQWLAPFFVVVKYIVELKLDTRGWGVWGYDDASNQYRHDVRVWASHRGAAWLSVVTCKATASCACRGIMSLYQMCYKRNNAISDRPDFD